MKYLLICGQYDIDVIKTFSSLSDIYAFLKKRYVNSFGNLIWQNLGFYFEIHEARNNEIHRVKITKSDLKDELKKIDV